MKSVFLALLGSLGLIPGAGTLLAAEGSRPEKPNIIVILSDDHGWADLAAQGVRDDVRTPNLDALAAGGLRATNGYVTAPQCVPSRAGLLTGRYQQRFGVESNGEVLEGFAQQQTIASRLKMAGYATGMTGKWHLGPENKITEHGFDDVYCTQGAVGMNLRAWANFDLDGKTTPGAPVNRNDLYHVEVNGAAARAFIKRHAMEPFFFYLAYRAPHTPLDAPEKYTARFPGPMPERRRRALAAVAAIDDGVGRVMETLRELGLEEKTLIFFMGDNGAPLKMTMVDSPPNTDAGGWDGSLNIPMNGEKGMLAEGGVRVPWLAYWKGTIPPGQVDQRPAISLDVAATAVALARLSGDPALDGVNLIPFYTGQIKGAPHEALYWRWIAQSAIREGRWKLLVAGSRVYLFDLEADPGEKHDLIARHPDVAKRLRTRLEAWSGGLRPPGVNIKPMAKVWEDHYDFFFDGKPVLAPDSADNKSGHDWIARNSTAAVKDGALHITPDKASRQRPFIACAKLKIRGPVTATLGIRSPTGEKAGLAWRLDGQKDFLPEQAVSVDLPASPGWQEVTAAITARGQIIHLRLLLPDGETDIRRIELKTPKGDAVMQWDFESK